MKFDLTSMKKRTKIILKKLVPTVYLISFIITVIDFGRLVLGMRLMNTNLRVFFVTFTIGLILKELINIGYIQYAINAAREKNGRVKDLVGGFYKNILKNLGVVILKQIILWIGFILLFIPGIIAFYRLRFVYYDLLNENKSISICIKDSLELTKGNCLELFKIDLSFVGWYLLNVVTLGLASVYVRPLTTITYAEYYDYLRAQKQIAK